MCSTVDVAHCLSAQWVDRLQPLLLACGRERLLEGHRADEDLENRLRLIPAASIEGGETLVPLPVEDIELLHQWSV